MMRDIEGLKLNNKGSSTKSVPSGKKSSRQNFCEIDVGSHATNPPSIPLGDYTNKTHPLTPTKLTKKWNKLACVLNRENQAAPLHMDLDRAPRIESDGEQCGKRQCMDICEEVDKENFQVVTSPNNTMTNELLKLEQIVFLMETKIEKTSMERIGRKM